MINIIADLHNYISALESFADVQIDELNQDSDSICVRVEPGSSNESRDLTGKRYGDFQFAIYCKSADKERCITQITLYITELDLAGLSLTDRINIKCEPLTEPHFISKADNGESIYTASFHLEYYEGV